MQKLISVIVPVYNTAPYLNHCIDSILLQTYPNIEIIIVNDGSNDSSGKIIENIVNEHQNIKYIELPMNQGLSAARNIGLEVATGDYIGFVDSDDWIEDSMYEVLYNGIQTYQKQWSPASLTMFYTIVEEAGYSIIGRKERVCIYQNLILLCKTSNSIIRSCLIH